MQPVGSLDPERHVSAAFQEREVSTPVWNLWQGYEAGSAHGSSGEDQVSEERRPHASPGSTGLTLAATRILPPVPAPLDSALHRRRNAHKPARRMIARLRFAMTWRRPMVRRWVADRTFLLLDLLLGWRRGRPRVIRMLLPAANAQFTHREFLPIVWLDGCRPEAQCEPGQRGTAVSPNIAGRAVTAEVVLPPVRQYAFSNVQIVANSTVFTSESNLIIERVPGIDDARCRFSGGRLVTHGRHLAEIDVRPLHGTPLDNGFFLSGYGAFNYYHWMIELLPKLSYWRQLSPELRTYPLLVSEAVREYPSMMEALAMFCDEAETRVLNDDEVYTVGHLIHINAPNTCPFNLEAGHEVRVTDFLVRPETIRDWRRRVGIGQRHGPTDGRRLFLARSAAHRSYNEEEILPVFVREGFEPVYLERMSLREQIAAINSAELIAGPTGAAWTNLIFCGEGAKGLCWLPDQAKQFSAFSTIANIVGVDLRYLTYPTDARSTFDLYSADYRLEVGEVERALSQLLVETRS